MRMEISKKPLFISMGAEKELKAESKKIIGEAPGKNWTSITMSIQETARLLGIAEGTLYDLMKKKPFKTVKVGMYTRIYIDSLEDFSRYVFDVPYTVIQEALQRKDIMSHYILIKYSLILKKI